MDTKHPLAAWMDRKKISQSEFAADCGCSEGHLSLVLRRERGVSMRLAKRFSDATGGKVRIADFLLADDFEVRA